MKIVTFLLALIYSVSSYSQDTSPILVNLSDNTVVQYSGSFVKQKATVLEYRPVINGTKDFYIKVKVSYYQNNSGAYGSKIIDLIQACGACSQEQKNLAAASYQDWVFEYQTTGKFVNASGDVVAQDVVGSIPENQYWQSFTLTQAGIGSLSTGAFSAQYTMIAAIVAKLNTRKSW